MFETIKTKMSNSAVRATMFITTAIAMVGGASAVNMTEAFQPVIDMIAVLTDNTDSWVSLVVLGVIIAIVVAVGAFVKGIMSRATTSGR